VKFNPEGPPLLFVNRLIDECRFTCLDFRVLTHFTRCAGPFSMNRGSYGYCKRSLRNIAGACGISVNSVRKIVANLVSLGVLKPLRQAFQNDPDHYTVEKMRDWNWEALGVPRSKVTDEDKRSERALLFVHSAIDEFGFTPRQFRLLAHIARRGGGFSKHRGSDHECCAGLRSMARVCRMGRKKVHKTLAELVELNVLERSRRSRADSHLHRIRPMIEWVCQSEAQKEILNRIRIRCTDATAAETGDSGAGNETPTLRVTAAQPHDRSGSGRSASRSQSKSQEWKADKYL
jgi:DNA-binding MarR family transcriptional regulator